MKLSPFIKYFGSKNRIAKKYPAPITEIIIEPFAGGAGYSHAYPHKNVYLYDKYEIIVAIWDWLIRVSESEFLQLPNLFLSTEFLAIPQEAKWFLGFQLGITSASPKKETTVTALSAGHNRGLWCEYRKHKLSEQLQYIRHWKVSQLCYKEINFCDVQADWFIDPPYTCIAGKSYVHNNIDYLHLAEWVKKLNGQVIVCENMPAQWLPFSKLCDNIGSNKQSRSEVMYHQINGIQQ